MTQPTNLFLPRNNLRAWSLSAAVGSGKTKAAVAWMAGPLTASRNVIYVAPTLKLLNQTEANLRNAIGRTTGATARNVNLITRETASGRVEAEAIASINEADDCEGRVQMLTTPTFLAIISHIERPELWSVICDEAFEPATFSQFRLGSDVAKGWAHFSELFSIDAAQGHRILPSEGRRVVVDEVSRGDYRQAGDRFGRLELVAKAVANPAMRCELLMTDGAKALVAGELPAARDLEATDDDKGGPKLQFSSYVDPAAFRDFREVLFLSALFERTVLHALWTRALGVTFASHPDFPIDMLRDTHKAQGRYLAVGHLLHEADNASLENMKKDAITGLAGPGKEGDADSVRARTRVIDRLVQTAAAHFGEEPFLLQSNPRYGYVEGATILPRTAVYIPPVSQGRNDFDGVDNVAALFLRNPNTQELAWVMDRTGMTAREATQAFRIHSVYQALGRCSIRKWEPTTTAKVVLTAGADDATFIRDLFPGSHWLGQVGTMPSLDSLKVQGDRKELGKTEATALAILSVLNELDVDTNDIKGQELKALVESRKSRDLLNLYGPDGTNGVPKQTWSVALSQACSQGTGWRRQGRSLVRITAELYGFQTQHPAGATAGA